MEKQAIIINIKDNQKHLDKLTQSGFYIEDSKELETPIEPTKKSYYYVLSAPTGEAGGYGGNEIYELGKKLNENMKIYNKNKNLEIILESNEEEIEENWRDFYGTVSNEELIELKYSFDKEYQKNIKIKE